eukprot:gene9619-10602_t
MEAVAIREPKRKQRADRVEPITDNDSEISGPSQRPDSAWSAKDEDITRTFAATDQTSQQSSDKAENDNHPTAESTSGQQDSSSVSGSRGMLQRMKKNVVVPVDKEVTDSESSTTRINVVGKRDIPGAWDNNGHEADDDSSGSRSRPTSAPLYRQPKTQLHRPTSAPQSKLKKDYRPLGKDGPYQQQATKEQIIDESEILEIEPQRPNISQSIPRTTERPASITRADSATSRSASRALERVGSRAGHLSTGTASSDSLLAPPVASGEHQAYIPFDYAKDCIARVVDNMKRMKSSHVKVVENIQDQYSVIEEHTQGQFNDYVLKLRLEYGDKVTTFRKIVEIHQAELERSQDYWHDAIASLKAKNKLLIEDKRKYLQKAHERFDTMEDEKLTVVKQLTDMLDKKHADYLAVLKKLKVEEQKCEELEKETKEHAAKETELQQQKSNEMESEKKSLLDQLEEKQTLIVALETEKSTAEETIKQKDEDNSELKSSIEQLEIKIKELENRPIAAVGVVTSESTISAPETSSIEKEAGVSDEPEKEALLTTATTAATTSTTGLIVAGGITSEESEKLQKKIKELEHELIEQERHMETLKNENEDLHEKTLRLRNESASQDLAVLELKRDNENLKKRLEVAVSQMADSVDTNDVEQRLKACEDERGEIQQENEKFNENLEAWVAEFREEHDGHEPAEEDRTEEVQRIVEDLKANNEKLTVMNADIAVMKLLLGTPEEELEPQQDSSNQNEELIRKLIEEKNSLLDDVENTERLVQELKESIENLKEENGQLQTDKEALEDKIEDLESREPSVVVTEKIVESVSDDTADDTAEEGLRAELEQQEKDFQLKQAELYSKISEINTENEALQTLIETLTKERDDGVIRIQELEGKLANEETSFQGQIDSNQKEVDLLKMKIEELDAARLSNLPVDAADEIKNIQVQLKSAKEDHDKLNKELLAAKSNVASLNLSIDKTNKTLEKEKERNEQLQTEKKKLKSDNEKKIKELEQKIATAATAASSTRQQAKSSKEDATAIKTLKKKVDTLEKQLASAKEKQAQPVAVVKETKEPKGPSLAEEKLKKENEKLNEKIEAYKKTSKEDREKSKALQNEIKELKDKLAKSGPSIEDKMAAKKQEKKLQELQKSLDTEKKKTEKLKGDLSKTEEELASLKKELNEANLEIRKKTDEIDKLGIAAKQGAEAMDKVVELEGKCRGLVEENKTLTENYNSERLLRKKYYNIVEDMKGKIRVYARARPLSKSEQERGNFSVIKSPDEYTLVVDTQRGPREFQYDQIFMPDSTQEKVFEDTNNLIQSAVDGYNVCIFAYGQTGSGKTFTVIGDNDRKFPGIAPRAFDSVFNLIEENKKKFSFKVQLYMLELYMDRLIDLFGTNKDAKLDIHKDKKGMVVVPGAVVHEINSSDQLMQMFEKGSSTRHTSSTKMNAESSRSHLVISIIIESTNLTSGAVTKGKLSLVDLAGSERAAKTGASPEQLKEAQSINKSLSALGDVISALSSEQAFIPYRNNKLTMLMQDSLGGNAKTLMFVNISPADYNCDETITSLTYASRVKLITNDASKNAESKEISRLKAIISNLKKGETVDDEEIDG